LALVSLTGSPPILRGDDEARSRKHLLTLRLSRYVRFLWRAESPYVMGLATKDDAPDVLPPMAVHPRRKPHPRVLLLALERCVGVVVLVPAEKQVRRIHAPPNVASVADEQAIGDWSLVHGVPE